MTNPAPIQTDNAAILLTYEDWLLALCLWREARGSSPDSLTAIKHVILNRANDPQKRWPSAIPSVILQHYQFSSFNAGDPNSTKFPLPNGSSDWTAFLSCVSVATQPSIDPTSGANCYESLSPDQTKPAWAQADKITYTSGPFRFYKL